MKNFKIVFILGLFAISLNGAAFAGDDRAQEAKSPISESGVRGEISECPALSVNSAKKPVVAPPPPGSSESSSDSKPSSSAK